MTLCNISLTMRICHHLAQHQRLKVITYHLSLTSYSIYIRDSPPHLAQSSPANRGRDMTWSHGQAKRWLSLKVVCRENARALDIIPPGPSLCTSAGSNKSNKTYMHGAAPVSKHYAMIACSRT